MPDNVERGSQGEGVEKSEHIRRLEAEAHERGLDEKLINRLSHFFEVRESENIHIVDSKAFAEGHVLLVEHLPTQPYPYFDREKMTKRIETMIMVRDESGISDRAFGKTQAMYHDIPRYLGDYNEKIEDIQISSKLHSGGTYEVSASPLRNPLY